MKVTSSSSTSSPSVQPTIWPKPSITYTSPLYGNLIAQTFDHSYINIIRYQYTELSHGIQYRWHDCLDFFIDLSTQLSATYDDKNKTLLWVLGVCPGTHGEQQRGVMIRIYLVLRGAIIDGI